ncbi:potassium-transporting ATPase [Mycobacterium haemophilum]
MNGDKMSVVIYLLLTVAIFAILGTAVKLVDRL